MRQTLIPPVSFMQISRCIRRVWVHLPILRGLMRQFQWSEVAAKENKWQRSNATRWHNEAYDNLFHAAEGELDPGRRAALFIAMNDMVVEDGVVIPVVCRP